MANDGQWIHLFFFVHFPNRTFLMKRDEKEAVISTATYLKPLLRIPNVNRDVLGIRVSWSLLLCQATSPRERGWNKQCWQADRGLQPEFLFEVSGKIVRGINLLQSRLLEPWMIFCRPYALLVRLVSQLCTRKVGWRRPDDRDLGKCFGAADIAVCTVFIILWVFS